ncbi:MAG: hypothetical protein ACE5F1_14360 [Planctomycetota bacterium]
MAEPDRAPVSTTLLETLLAECLRQEPEDRSDCLEQLCRENPGEAGQAAPAP